jgi:hypothetical protein
VDNYAAMKIKDGKGFLPIHYAVIRDDVPFLKSLQSRGVNIFNKDFYFDSQSLMNLAVLNGAFDVVKFLFSR